jgi:hypothetical protein
LPFFCECESMKKAQVPTSVKVSIITSNSNLSKSLER